MSVHRGDQTGGQGLLPFGMVTRWRGSGPCPTCLLDKIRDSGTAAEVSSGSGNRTLYSGAVIIPEWLGGIIPEWVGRVPKAEPRIARNAPGLIMSRSGGLGGVVSATLIHIIASP
jgi:hypothetical protein